MSKRPNSKAFTFGAASAIALPANGGRVALILSPALVESYSVGFGEAAVINGGITIRPGMQPFLVTIDDIGDVIKSPVHVVGTGAASAPLFEISEA